MNKKISICVFSLLLIFSISGCKDVDLSKVSKEDINKVIVCDPPYMRYASECCLDANGNKICDRDEGITPTPTIPASPYEKITDDIFDTANTEIGKLHTGAKFTVAPIVDVKQGSRANMFVYVGNDGSDIANCKSFFLELGKHGTFNENEIQVKVISTNPVDLDAGEEARFVIQAVAVKNAPLSTGSPNDPAYSITARCAAANAGLSSQVYDTAAFTINVQEQIEETANTQIICATEVDYNIRDVCKDGSNGYKVTIDNKGSRKIDSLIVSGYVSQINVKTQEMFTSSGIGAYNIQQETFTAATSGVKLIETIPKTTVSGIQITCSANIKDFGDVNGSTIRYCS